MECCSSSCSCTPGLEKKEICPACKEEGIAVKSLTLTHMVKKERLKLLPVTEGFYFCRNPECGVVYFNREIGVLIHKEEVRVRVGIKEKDDPVPLCYCFGWTRKKIYDEIRRKGYSTAIKDISEKAKKAGCRCEVKNPSGRCCIEEVKKAVKEGMRLYGRKEVEDEGLHPCC